MGKRRYAKDVVEILEWAKETYGFTYTKTGGDHWRIYSEKYGLIFCASTPSDHRALQNIRHEILRRVKLSSLSAPK